MVKVSVGACRTKPGVFRVRPPVGDEIPAQVIYAFSPVPNVKFLLPEYES